MVKRLVIVLVLLLSAAAGLWYGGVPDRWVAGRIEGLLQGGGVGVELEGFRKTPLFGFEIEEVRVAHRRKLLLRMEDVSGRIDPSGLLVLGLRVLFSGTLSGGTVSGEVLFRRGGVRADVALHSVRLGDLAVLSGSMIRGDGVIGLEAVVEGRGGDGLSGHVSFEIRDMRVGDLAGGKVYLPLGLFSRLRGAVSFRGRDLRVDALSLKGEQVLGRIEGGVVSKGYFEGVLDLTAGADLPAAYAPLVEPYRVSARYYRIPFRGVVRELL